MSESLTVVKNVNGNTKIKQQITASVTPERRKTSSKVNGVINDKTSYSNGTSITSNSQQNKEFPYPNCWQDDDRMLALFAPFRLRSVNPLHYDNKLKFWKDLIVEYCEFKGSATFKIQELKLAFKRGERLPSCLDVVIQDFQQTKKVRIRCEYEYDPTDSWSGWAMTSFVKRPLSWGWNSLKGAVGLTDENSYATVEYVQLDVMKKFCEELEINVLTELQGKLLHFDAMKQHVADIMNLTDDCLGLCLITLQSHGKIGLEYKQINRTRQIHLIKVPDLSTNDISITDVDHAVHNLQMTRANLMKQLENFEYEIQALDVKIREYLKENRRQFAKNCLRKKHLIEKAHEKRSVALNNIETLLCSVDEAQNHGDILDAYKFGSKALVNVLNKTGLKYDDVEEVVSDVRESLDAHREIQDIISNTSFSDSNANEQQQQEDDDEIERELRELFEESVKTINKKPNANSTNIETNANDNVMTATLTVTSPLSQKSQPSALISDDELLKMLEDLEVETETPNQSYQDNNNCSMKSKHSNFACS